MAKVYCELDEITLENDFGYEVESVEVTCRKCQHTTESYGVGDASVSRCLALLAEECPLAESNWYVIDNE